MNKVEPKAAEPERAPSSPEIVFRGIVEGLYVGRYVPGQRLVEADLIRDFDISRGSVREALNRLAAEGIIRLSPHRGAEVRRLTRTEAHDSLVMLELLIGLAVRLAAERIDEGENRALFTASVERLLAFEQRAESFELVRARDRFYQTLVRIGGNSELARVLPSMHVHLLRIQFRGYHTAADDERFHDYRRIAEAVLAGEGRRAELAGRKHIRRLVLALDQLPDGAFASGVTRK